MGDFDTFFFESEEIDACWSRIGLWGDSSCPKLADVAHCRNCEVYTSAAHRLLDRRVGREYSREWTSHFAKAAKRKSQVAGTLMVFRLGREWLGLPSRAVQEVLELRPVHVLPHRTSGTLLGVVNVRGLLVPCISLQSLLGIEHSIAPTAEGRAFSRLMVLQDDSGRLVIRADEVFGLVKFEAQELTSAPATLSLTQQQFVKTLLPREGKQIGVLDGPLLFYNLNRQLA